jgi:hypothetical protein
MYKSLVGFLILFTLVSAGCTISTVELTPKAVPTPTPEPLTLIDGKIDACLLITPLEIESVVGDKVSAEIMYPTGYTGCRYISITDEQVLLQVYVATDTTVKRDKFLSGIEVYTAVDAYELLKTGELNFEQKLPAHYKVEDIDGLGDQAYMSEGTFITIYVLNHNISYQFTTRAIDDGVGYDALMKLTKIALQRMPVSDISTELSGFSENFFE